MFEGVRLSKAVKSTCYIPGHIRFWQYLVPLQHNSAGKHIRKCNMLQVFLALSCAPSTINYSHYLWQARMLQPTKLSEWQSPTMTACPVLLFRCLDDKSAYMYIKGYVSIIEYILPTVDAGDPAIWPCHIACSTLQTFWQHVLEVQNSLIIPLAAKI